MNKLCSRCKKYKEMNDFNYSSVTKDNKNAWCKDCYKEYRENRKEHQRKLWKEYYLKNKEKESLRLHNWYIRNKKMIMHFGKGYVRNKEKYLKYQKEYRDKHKDISKEYAINYYHDNIDKCRQRSKLWGINNIDKRKQYMKLYKINNRDYFNAKKTERKAILLNAIPGWTDFDKIKEVYSKAKELEKVTGIKYHVDHVVPLQSKNVCGFHVWENLQILADKLNISKGNKFNYMEV
jgi:hypothetical protein